MRRIARVLLRLFPAGFREQFGEDMVEQIEIDRARAAARGRFRAFAFDISTVFDLVCSGLAERWNPAWLDEPMVHNPRKGMGLSMDGWSKDLRQAVRSLRRSPGFFAVSVVTLGLALGALAGIFSVVDTVLLKPLPYPQPDRLVYIAATAPGSDLPQEFAPAAEMLVQYREKSQLLENVAVFGDMTQTLRAGDRAERVWMSWATPELFPTLGVTPILGRLPVAADEDRAMVISYQLWMTWFGGDRGVIGKSFEAAGASRQVIGVMPANFHFPTENVLLWVPQVIRPAEIILGRFGMRMVGRLAPGATQDGLRLELNRLAAELPARFGGSSAYARIMARHRAIVRSLEEQLVGGVAGTLWVLLGAVAIVLLIACANVANLLLVRAERRGQDLAIRKAIGAGRSALIRSQMAETVIIAAAAGVLAVLLAWITLPLVLRVAPSVPRLSAVHLRPDTLAFTLAAAFVSALLCGLGPAVRSSNPKLTRLRDSSRGSTRRRSWGRDGLVVAQTALALLLLIGSGLLLRSFRALRHVDPGYETKDLFTFQFAPENPALHDGPSWALFHDEFLKRIAALPGVQSVGIVENVPLDEGTANRRFRSDEMAGDPERGALLNFTFTGGDYFSTMGIAVLAGRAFTPADHTTNLGNVIVSRSAAKLLWPGQDPIGKRLQPWNPPGQTGPEPPWMSVVGVVEDVMQYGLRDGPNAQLYFPMVGPTPNAWALSSPGYVVKTPRANSIAPDIRALVKEVAPEAPMYRVYTMEGLASRSMLELSFTTLTLGIAALLALILGTVGLYGVLSYVVAERTREIGVRMALGAEAGQVRRMVVSQGVAVVVPGIMLGLIGAFASTRVLGSLLFGVKAIDGLTFVSTSGAMVLTGLLASYLPARRASSVDPIESLRID